MRVGTCPNSLDVQKVGLQMAVSANSVCPKARPKARPCFLFCLVNCAVSVCNYVQLISSFSSFSYIFIGFHHSQAFSDAAVAVAQIEPFECLWFEDAAIPMLCDTAEAEPGILLKDGLSKWIDMFIFQL